MPDISHDVQETLGLGSRAAARSVVTGTFHGEFAGISAERKSFTIDQRSLEFCVQARVLRSGRLACAALPVALL